MFYLYHECHEPWRLATRGVTDSPPITVYPGQ